VKFNKIRLVGASTVDLPIEGADAAGPFVFKGAEGLGPVEVVVSIAQTTSEGGTYQGKRAVNRQAIVKIGLQPDWNIGQTAEELRTILYGLLTPRYGQMVVLQIMLDDVVLAECRGQIPRMEASIFVKDPEVSIVLDSTHPYLVAPATIRQQPVQRTVAGLKVFDVENDGTAPTGFRMGLILRANVGTTLTLSDDSANGQKISIVGINWVSGDRLVIDTRPRNRGVWRGAAGGTPVSALNNLDAAVSEWLQLYGGDNTLRINASAFDWDPAYDFQHQPAYWGV
jgi:hypothetical protein